MTTIVPSHTMVPEFDPAFSKMLSTPVPLEGPRKDAIEALQKRIDFHTAESNRLRYAQNSHVAISRLPPETLSEVFLCLVESGIDDRNTYFARGTFDFLQVCRRWNEVATGFPRLWVWRIPGAVKAWPLFETRSKDAPIFLTWRPDLPTPDQDILMDPTTQGRLRRFDFGGSIEQLAHLLGAFDPSAPSNTSSIRIHIVNPYTEHPKYIDRFLSSSFPKLSVIDIEGFLPDSLSPIFTSSNLTSLRLHSHFREKPRYTLSQFSEILQQHPNLRELDLNDRAIPVTEPPGPLVPFVLPRLVVLRLHGYKSGVVGFSDLIGVSSPLRNIDILIQDSFTMPTPTLIGVMKKILTTHYECPGLDRPRTTHSLTISSGALGNNLAFDAGSHSTSTSHPASNLKLNFTAVGLDRAYGLVKDTFPLFQLDHVQEFTAAQLNLPAEVYFKILKCMKGLLHLRLDNLDVEPVFYVLDLDQRAGLPEPFIHKLQSLTLSNLKIPYGQSRRLLRTLSRRCKRKAGLKSLVIRSCRVARDMNKPELRALAEKVTWENVSTVYSGNEESDSD